MIDPNKYKKMFIDGAMDCIAEINEALAVLEKNFEDVNAVQVLFRSFHSIKGMSATMDYANIMELSHTLEDLLDAIRGGKVRVSPEKLDILFAGSDCIEKMIHVIEDASAEQVDVKPLLGRIIQASVPIPPASGEMPVLQEKKREIELSQADLSELRQSGEEQYKLHITISRECVSPAARAYLLVEALKEKSAIIKTIPSLAEIENGNVDCQFEVYLGTEAGRTDIESVVNSSVEIESFNLAIINVAQSERANDPRKLLPRVQSAKNADRVFQYRKPAVVKVETQVLDNLIEIVGEIFIKKNQLKDITGALQSDKATESVGQLEKLVQKLYKEAMTLRLVPMTLLTEMIPRIIRETLHGSDKKVECAISGNDITLDRTIVEKLSDPLIHLIRNSIDHGIESPHERRQAGKPEAGKLTFSATREKGFIHIEIADDGRGIDLDSVREKIIAKGLAARDDIEKADQAEVLSYIWIPGFSTAAQITSVSGRGVGMDIVNTVVRGVGGRASVKATTPRGTTFLLQIPATISIIKTFRITLDNDIYAIPLAKVIRTIEIPAGELITDNDGMVFSYRKEKIAVHDLKALLQYSSSGITGKKTISVLIVDAGGNHKIGLIVDSFLSSYDTVVKPLGMPLEKLSVFNGVTVSEKGELILIFDVDKFCQPR